MQGLLIKAYLLKIKSMIQKRVLTPAFLLVLAGDLKLTNVSEIRDRVFELIEPLLSDIGSG